MRAIIHAGGFGTRLSPLTDTLPKPMVSVAGKPLLERIIYWCRSYSVTELLITLHYLPDNITEYFKDGSKHGVSIHYCLEKKPLGGAGAIKNCWTKYPDFFSDDLCILNGDTYSELDLNTLYQFHKKVQSDFTCVIHPTSHPQDSDLVETDKNNQIKRFYRNPQANASKDVFYGNAGIYVMNPRVLSHIPSAVPYSIEKQLIPTLLSSKGDILFAYKTNEMILDIGTMERVETINQYVQQKDKE